MDDEPTTPVAKPVSFDKRTGADARVRPGLLGRGKPNLAADGSPMPPPPKQVRYAALALCVSAVAALVASLSLFGLKDWLLREATKSNAKLKTPKALDTLPHTVDSTVKASLVSTVVLLLALMLAARGVVRGRSWARWTVIVLWVLATFTGTFASFTYLLNITSNEPIAFKISSFVSAAALIVAVVFVSVKASGEYFALTKPPRPDGAPARRGGLFGPRPPRAAATVPAVPRTSVGREAAERSRAKQRATSESVAKGAELARARAKASKSRRTGV